MYVIELFFSTTADLVIYMYLVKLTGISIFPIKSWEVYIIPLYRSREVIKYKENLPRQLKVYQQYKCAFLNCR